MFNNSRNKLATCRFCAFYEYTAKSPAVSVMWGGHEFKRRRAVSCVDPELWNCDTQFPVYLLPKAVLLKIYFPFRRVLLFSFSNNKNQIPRI